MERLRVGLYIPDIDINASGAPTKYLLNLAQNLSEMDDIELFLLHHRTVTSEIRAKHVIIRHKIPIVWEANINKLLLDIVHFNFIPRGRRIFFPTLNCKKVVTVHGGMHCSEELDVYNSLNNRLRRLMERPISKFFDAVIAVSKDLQRRLVRCLKIPQYKIRAVYEGISPIYKPTKNCGIKEKYQIKRPYILHVSNFAPKKNPSLLFQTFKELLRRGMKLELVIAGKGWHAEGEHVKALGYVPEPDLVSLFGCAEVFFFPTLHETFGLPVVEAMACGTPVVTSNVFSIPEISGGAAILCNPENYLEFSDSIEMVLRNESLRQELVVKGLKNAKRFSWRRCAVETVKIYKQLQTP